ncbi:hypothetical protein HanHA300_Chr10g0363111 [Helianthus annuus]|nr:hypothetical protein HanHA300_Chr10g0363111 [Helianthus annuus]
MVMVASMDGSRQEVQVCSRWMRRKATSDGDGMKRLMIGAAFRSCEREFWYCLLSTFGIGGHLRN